MRLPSLPALPIGACQKNWCLPKKRNRGHGGALHSGGRHGVSGCLRLPPPRSAPLAEHPNRQRDSAGTKDTALDHLPMEAAVSGRGVLGPATIHPGQPPRKAELTVRWNNGTMKARQNVFALRRLSNHPQNGAWIAAYQPRDCCLHRGPRSALCGLVRCACV